MNTINFSTRNIIPFGNNNENDNKSGYVNEDGINIPDSFINRNGEDVDFERQPDSGDEFVPKTQRPQKKRKGTLRYYLKGAGVGAAASLAAVFVFMPKQHTNTPNTIKVANRTMESSDYYDTLEEIYDVDKEAIALCNLSSSTDDLNNISEIYIPTKYDPLEEKIEDLRNQLYDDSLSSEKRSEIEDKILQYKFKKQAQNEAAIAYDAGDSVCFKIKELPKDTNIPAGLLTKNNKLTVGSFRAIFDIPKDEKFDIAFKDMTGKGPNDVQGELLNDDNGDFIELEPGDVIYVDHDKFKND